MITEENKIAYLQEGIYTTVEVTFVEDRVKLPKRYIYKLHNDMKEAAIKNKFAVVETNCGYKTVKIEEVHDESEIDYTKSYQWKWVVDIIEDNWYLLQLEAEKKVSKYMKQNKVKKELEKEIGQDLEYLKTQAKIEN